MKKIITIMAVIGVLVGSSIAHAADGGGNGPAASTSSTNSGLNYTNSLVQCDGVISKNEPNRREVCNFANLVNMIKYIINWAFALTIPVMIGLLAYAGILHMSGKEDKIKKSYKIMQNAVIGFALTLCAWFIVTTVLKWVLNDAFKGAVETLVETQK